MMYTYTGHIHRGMQAYGQVCIHTFMHGKILPSSQPASHPAIQPSSHPAIQPSSHRSSIHPPIPPSLDFNPPIHPTHPSHPLQGSCIAVFIHTSSGHLHRHNILYTMHTNTYLTLDIYTHRVHTNTCIRTRRRTHARARRCN